MGYSARAGGLVPRTAVLVALVTLGAGPPFGTPGAPPAVPPLTGPLTPQTLRSPPVRGLGPRLAAHIRDHGPDAPQTFLARGLHPDRIRAAGGKVHAQIGPIVQGELSGGLLVALAPSATFVEAPQSLRLALDLSRADIGADEVDFGDGFPSKYRGRGAIVAAYDSGMDLTHPDFFELDGPSRVLAVWDQDLLGFPPPGRDVGHVCEREVISSRACAHGDPIGHGTHVMSIAAGSGPAYRGVAPDASIVLASDFFFEHFLETLVWFDEVAQTARMPLVVNLSLGGHGGPHDGTSLEAQAVDAYEHLVVAAAGNDGQRPLHAMTQLEPGRAADVALQFPVLPRAATRNVAVEIWGDVGLPLSAQVAIVRPGGEVLAESSTASIGGEGRTEPLIIEGQRVGTVRLDPEAEFNPFNGQAHIRVQITMVDWLDPPNAPGFVTVRVAGEGRVDLWTDTPASEPAPVRFDPGQGLDIDTQIPGDDAHTISDIATAVSVIAVAAYTTRTEFRNIEGRVQTALASLNAIAPFTSNGPSLSEATTGPKPDLAAPGLVIIGARSRDLANDPGLVSPLYRALAGTSMSAPHVAGTAALMLGANPKLTRAELKQMLLGSAATSANQRREVDPRWGAGRLDTAAAMALVVGREEGCGCENPRGAPRAAGLWLVVGVCALWVRRRRG